MLYTFTASSKNRFLKLLLKQNAN